MIVVVVLVGGGFSLWVWIFCAEIDFSGLVNWVSLDLEKNMKNEVHVLGWRFLGLMIFLGWRFDDFFGLVFSCGFGFDDFFLF